MAYIGYLALAKHEYRLSQAHLSQTLAQFIGSVAWKKCYNRKNCPPNQTGTTSTEKMNKIQFKGIQHGNLWIPLQKY